MWCGGSHCWQVWIFDFVNTNIKFSITLIPLKLNTQLVYLLFTLFWLILIKQRGKLFRNRSVCAFDPCYSINTKPYVAKIECLGLAWPRAINSIQHDMINRRRKPPTIQRKLKNGVSESFEFNLNCSKWNVVQNYDRSFLVISVLDQDI